MEAEYTTGVRSGKTEALKKDNRPKKRLIPRACAQHDCFHNDGFACFKFDYTGPTMAEFCPHYSRD